MSGSNLRNLLLQLLWPAIIWPQSQPTHTATHTTQREMVARSDRGMLRRPRLYGRRQAPASGMRHRVD
uniref:Putative secreted protein n=1 Tax=Anopheles darlingi TaxID=43151 RepID=A0A2M4DR65_ANODA